MRKPFHWYKKPYEMVALEALIGIFLDWAENGLLNEKGQSSLPSGMAAEEVELYMHKAVQAKIARGYRAFLSF